MQHEEDTSLSVTVHIVKAFAINGSGGNPAGVVLDADGLDEVDMQAIAAQTGLSETAFVSRSMTEGAQLDFFTPNRRIPHCGHATVAAFALMHAKGRITEGMTSKQTVDGPRMVLLRDGLVFMEQRRPSYQSEADWSGSDVRREDILDALHLAADDLDPRIAPEVVDTGNRFLLLAVVDARTLAAIVPDHDALVRISEALGVVGFYVFTQDTGAKDVDATARMFAPLYGIREESATGMAAGPLACLLHDRFGFDRSRFVIEQGRYMASPSISRIIVDLDLHEDGIAALMAGGEGHSTQALCIEPATGDTRGPKRTPQFTDAGQLEEGGHSQ